MFYIIHDVLAFRPDDGAIWLLDDESQKTIVTPTASRLLNMLIDNHGIMQPREDILEKVWDAYGLEASNNSLNQNISLIRRTLISFGMPENTIKTIPKFGFLFSADIKIEKCNEKQVENTKKNNKIISSSIKRLVLPSAFILFFLVGFYFFFHNISNKVEKLDPINIGDIDGCPVYYLDEDSAYTEKKWLDKAKSVFFHSGSQCDNSSIFYFRADDKVIHGNRGIVYFAACSQYEGKILSCRNHIIKDWGEL